MINLIIIIILLIELIKYILGPINFDNKNIIIQHKIFNLKIFKYILNLFKINYNNFNIKFHF